LKPITLLEEKNTTTVAEFLLSVKILVARKAAICDEIRPEIFKILNRGFLLMTHLSKWPEVQDGTEVLTNWGILHDPVFKKRDRTKYRASLSVAFREEFMASALKNEAAK